MKPLFAQGATDNTDYFKDKINLYSGTLTWHITPKVHLYTTISKGYVPAGFLSIITTTSFKAEKGTSKEIGYKLQLFNDRLFSTGAVFVNKYTDYQYYNFARLSMENIDKYESKGYELAINYLITPNLSVGATHSRVNPKILNYIQYSNLGMAPIDFSGKTVPWIPVSNSSINVTYSIPSQYGNFTWNTDVRRVGSYYKYLDNTLKSKPVVTVDSSLTYKKGPHQVTLWAKNLLNKKYFATVLRPSDMFQGGLYAKGRTLGINYTYKF